MTAALFALLLAPPVDPAELLQRVAARYAAFDSFLLEVKEARFHDTIATLQTHVRKRLALAPGDRFFLEVQAAKTLTIVSDGETVRGRLDDSRKTHEQPLGGPLHRLVEEQLDTLIRRHSVLDRFARSARFLRLEKVKTPTGRIECAVVEIVVAPSENPGWRETLWIDAQRALILRSDFQPSSISHDHTYSEYTLPPGEQTPTDGLFVFSPRKGERPRPSPSSPSHRPSAESGTPPA